MIRLNQTAPAGGDCTAPYSVEILGDRTVKCVIEGILKQGAREHGRISVRQKADEFCISSREIFEVRYSQGKLKTPVPEEFEGYMLEIVESATAHGGWGLMDYTLIIDAI